MTASKEARIRVLIVDDSSVVRSLLSKILSSDPAIEVVGTAPDPYVAREKLVALRPDVMTLDVEMPRMDGITFLEKVMTHLPTRTVMVSSLTVADSPTYLRALEAGAIDVVAKPAMDLTESLKSMGAELIARVKAASRARLQPLNRFSRLEKISEKANYSAATKSTLATTHQILAIASSTGGTEALKVVLCNLPANIPGTVIVQHMPPVFTKTYSEHLNSLVPFEVKEAVDGDRVLPGRVLLAPGNFHMVMVRTGSHYSIRLNQEPLLHGVRPAADYLFQSVAKAAGARAIGVVLTGMGRDGAEGLLAMRQAGAFTIAQDEETSVVYGMPKVAVELGGVMTVAPLQDIAALILKKNRS